MGEQEWSKKTVHELETVAFLESQKLKQFQLYLKLVKDAWRGEGGSIVSLEVMAAAATHTPWTNSAKKNFSEGWKFKRKCLWSIILIKHIFDSEKNQRTLMAIDSRMIFLE